MYPCGQLDRPLSQKDVPNFARAVHSTSPVLLGIKSAFSHGYVVEDGKKGPKVSISTYDPSRTIIFLYQEVNGQRQYNPEHWFPLTVNTVTPPSVKIPKCLTLMTLMAWTTKMFEG